MSDIEDLMREAQDLAYSYRATADGHHSRLRMFLQETYALHLRFRDNAEAFRELRRHPSEPPKAEADDVAMVVAFCDESNVGE